MNSVADVGHLTDVFSFVPPSLLARATGFRQGEALIDRWQGRTDAELRALRRARQRRGWLGRPDGLGSNRYMSGA